MDERLEPCRRCAEQKLKQSEHPRCAMRTCGCTCRDQVVDLAYPDTRLEVARLCRELLGSPFLSADTPEAGYVNGLLQDLLWEEMGRLLGVPQEQQRESLSDDEIENVRTLLETERLSSDEVRGLRQVLADRAAPRPSRPAAQLQRPRYQQPAPEELPSDPDPSDPYAELQAEDEEQRSPPPPPASTQQARRPRMPQKPAAGSQALPMPTATQLSGITAVQASQAHSMGHSAVMKAAAAGGTTGHSKY